MALLEAREVSVRFGGHLAVNKVDAVKLKSVLLLLLEHIFSLKFIAIL
jgi:ABC-type branched-subunit amino acid transport system ATPase component